MITAFCLEIYERLPYVLNFERSVLGEDLLWISVHKKHELDLCAMPFNKDNYGVLIYLVPSLIALIKLRVESALMKLRNDNTI